MTRMGIHRFKVSVGHDSVTVSAQSQSLRGSAYTVGSVKEAYEPGNKQSCKEAIKKGLGLLYPEKP